MQARSGSPTRAK